MDIVLALTLKWEDKRLSWDRYSWSDNPITSITVNPSQIIFAKYGPLKLMWQIAFMIIHLKWNDICTRPFIMMVTKLV